MNYWTGSLLGDWKLPVKECLSPWGTSKADGIDPIRLTVSSMSCDLSMVIAYYDDKWTHLFSWSLSTHFSSFLESWGHYLSSSDRQQWQPREQRACMTRHRWLFYSDEYIYSYFQRNRTSLWLVCSHLKYLPCDISFIRKATLF